MIQLGAIMDDNFIIQKIKELGWWYCPVDFGNGIVAEDESTASKLDSKECGTTKWEYIIKKNLPNLQGKRCLDIGCNNGITCINMARAGAREVIGIDNEEENSNYRFFEQALFVKEALEWRCNTKYNIEYKKMNMVNLPDVDLGQFDVATALCCIYYNSKGDIEKLINHLFNISNYVLFQLNCSGVHPEDIEEKSNPEWIKSLLTQAGFQNTKIICPEGYTHPIVVAFKEAENKINYANPRHTQQN